MQHTIISKTSSKGVQIEIKLKEYLPAHHIAHLYLDGQYVFGESTPALLKTPHMTPFGVITHWLGREGKAVGLTAAEATLIEDAIEEANRAAGRPSINREAPLLTMTEESQQSSRLDACRPANAAQVWCGPESMEPEDSHF